MASLLTTILYDNPANFVFDPVEVEFVGGKVKLKLINNLETDTQDFASDVGFTYDASLVEFVGGVCKQKNTSEPNEIFRVTVYSNNPDAIWNTAGSGLATAENGATTIQYNGKYYLDVSGAVSGKGYSYDGAATAFSNSGTIRMKVIPKYDLSPIANRYFFSLYNPLDTNNRMFLMHQSGGNIQFRVYDQAGVLKLSKNFGVWTPSINTEHEIELNIDTSDVVRLLIDGVQLGGVVALNFTRGTTSKFSAGGWTTVPSDMYIRDIQIFNTVQHTANYTPNPNSLVLCKASTVLLPPISYSGLGAIQSLFPITTIGGNPPPVSSSFTANSIQIQLDFQDSITQQSIDTLIVDYYGQIYPTDNPTVTTNAQLFMTELESMDSVETKVGTEEIRYAGKYNGAFYWVSGGLIVPSNGTYAESNTIQELQTALVNGSLDVNPDAAMQIVAFLHSSDGLSTPSITSLTVGYGFFVQVSNPAKCIVYGSVFDNSGEPVGGAKISVDSDDSFYNENLIALKSVAYTNSSGLFQLSLVETATNTTTVSVVIAYRQDGKTKKTKYTGITVPNQPTAALSSIVP